jgi:phosphoenolpyruvate synthase/pyruvate phosphate dikinase
LIPSTTILSLLPLYLSFRRLGLPVPPGCIITTETCLDYFKLNHTESEIDYFIEDKKIPDHLEEGYLAAIKKIENETGKKFGAAVEDGKAPLLLAIRAGAAVSIPGSEFSHHHLPLSHPPPPLPLP